MWDEILKGTDDDIVEAHKKCVHQTLVDGLLSVFSKDKSANSTEFENTYGYAHERKKTFFSIDAFFVYYRFFNDLAYHPDFNRNILYATYTTGALSLVRELSTPIKFKSESLHDELVHFHFSKTLHDIQYDFEPVNTRFLYLFSLPAEEIGRFLDSLLYVGPLRKIPERGDSGLWFRELGASQPKASWNEGLGAWDWMASASDEALGELNSKLNGAGSLETGFTVKRDQYMRLEKGSELFQALDKAQHEGLNEAAKQLLAEFIAQTSEVRLSLHNERTGLELEPYAMGTGISQVLPVVAAAVAAEEDKFAILEQPELHIHPKLQTTLGDIFLQAANKGAMFLLETHSEHLMLRLLRRIRETSDGSLPQDAPTATINDVAVNYVQKDTNDCTEVVSIAVTPDGDFARQWPDGFFDERAEELF
ncbi:DUF3696 domain-containing protein [Deltaproteobacteria bacterium OttesenSCG-928-M10]|nr:DUF3696 domain-containing protein [Deltaproteobacteria bacterium OttesenSCG-928-M10]